MANLHTVQLHRDDGDVDALLQEAEDKLNEHRPTADGISAIYNHPQDLHLLIQDGGADGAQWDLDKIGFEGNSTIQLIGPLVQQGMLALLGLIPGAEGGGGQLLIARRRS